MKGAFAYVPARFQEISGHGVRNSRICPPLGKHTIFLLSMNYRNTGAEVLMGF